MRYRKLLNRLSCLEVACLVRGLLLLAVLVLPLIAPAWAAPKEDLDSGNSEKLDAILLLDASGSMRITDPLRLRNQGAKLFTRSLKDGDRLGIIEFAESAKVIRPLSAFAPQQIDSVARDLERVGDSGIYTDILEGIKKAKDVFELSYREDAKQVVILFSDGKFEPSPSRGSVEELTQKLFEQYIPEIKGLGIKIYTLAFSEKADRELLKEIAVGTGAVDLYAAGPDDIQKAYADMFLAVQKPQVVPLTKAGFQIDEDVKEVTFYINRESTTPVTLVPPDKSQIAPGTDTPNIKWFVGQNFDVITVRAPQAGNWQIAGISSAEGFATVLTNLKLVTDWPSAVAAGQPTLLQVRLFDNDKAVVLPEMTDVVQYAYFITPTDRISEPVSRGALYDDGTHGDKRAKDGIFSNEVTLSDVGDYKLRIIARGPTFERNQQMPFRVKPPFISLSIYHKDAESQAARTLAEMEAAASGGQRGKARAAEDPNSDKDRDIIRVELSEDARVYKSIDVKLLAKDEQNRNIIIQMRSTKAEPLIYEVDEFMLPNAGKYELQAVVLATGLKGKATQEMTGTLDYQKQAREGQQHSGQVVVVEPKKEAGEPSKLLPILLMTLMNAGLAALAFVTLKKMQVNSAETMPVFTPLQAFSRSMEALQSGSSQITINLDDPKFAGIRAADGAAAAAAEPEEAPERPAEGMGQGSVDTAGLQTELEADLAQLLGESGGDDEEQGPGGEE